VICIFRPGLSESDIRVAIHNASDNGWEPGKELTVQSLPNFVHALRRHQSYPAVCIASHVASQKGVREETKKTILSHLDVEIARVQQELEHGDDPDKEVLEARLNKLQEKRSSDDEISLDCLKLIGDCGFDALQISSQEDEVHYRYLHRYKPNFGRAVPIITSDAHAADKIFQCDDGTPYLKMTCASASNESNIFEDLRNALRLGETRFSFRTPGAVQYWIAGIEVTPDSKDASRFWPFSDNGGELGAFCLPLSRNLNTLIGGRGAGKSAAIEAISFICQADEYTDVEIKDPPDWYKRAKATLAGCNVRLCIQFLGVNNASELPKRALFARRHFSESDEYESVQFFDVDDNELLANQIPEHSVQIFRLGEIERHAGASRLRALFDAICGHGVEVIENDIRMKKDELVEQRQEMVEIAKQIAELTEADTALREFLHRKELLAAVDRPEVKKAYEQVDHLEKAQKTGSSAKTEWGEIEGDFNLEANLSAVKDFFVKYRSVASTDDGEILPDHEALNDILGKENENGNNENSHLDRITEAAGNLTTQLNSVETDLSTFHDNVEDAARNARNALQQQGLPSGGKNREAKKKAYEDAQDALSQYCEFLEQWRVANEKRRATVEELQELAKKRSHLRVTTAAQITERLKRDLDSSILIIEADARSHSDTHDFRDWLEKHFSDQSFRYREKRISELLKKGLTPDSLHSLLTNIIDPDVSLLMISGNASKGGIDRENANLLYEKCTAIKRLPHT